MVGLRVMLRETSRAESLMRIDKSVEAYVTDSQGYKDAQQTLNQVPNVLGDF